MNVYKFGVFLLCATLLISDAVRSARAETAPPKELVQYVKDAQRLGLKDAQIKQNAVTAGWPADTVDKTISYVAGNANSTPQTGPPAEAPPKPGPPQSSQPPEPVAQQPPPASAQPAPAGAQEPSPERTDTPDRGVPDDYVIGAGDNIRISVWREPEASVPSVVVLPDGKITMPLLKEIEVAGMTPKQLEKVITEKLSNLIRGADVTVIVTGINSKKIYMVGAVKKEGTLPYTYRMSIMQALSEAGGITEYAKRKKIYVLRTQNGKDYRLPFNYDEVIKGEKMEQNIQVLPNDTIVVPH